MRAFLARSSRAGPQDDYELWRAGALWKSALHDTVLRCLSFLIQRVAPVAVAARLRAARAPAAPWRLDRPGPGELSWAREAFGWGADLAACLSECW